MRIGHLGRRVPWIIRRHPSDIGNSAESQRCGVTRRLFWQGAIFRVVFSGRIPTEVGIGCAVVPVGRAKRFFCKDFGVISECDDPVPILFAHFCKQRVLRPCAPFAWPQIRNPTCRVWRPSSCSNTGLAILECRPEVKRRVASTESRATRADFGSERHCNGLPRALGRGSLSVLSASRPSQTGSYSVSSCFSDTVIGGS
jgi:hypothetical protein